MQDSSAYEQVQRTMGQLHSSVRRPSGSSVQALQGCPGHSLHARILAYLRQHKVRGVDKVGARTTCSYTHAARVLGGLTLFTSLFAASKLPAGWGAPVPAQEELVLFAQLQRGGQVHRHGLKRVGVALQQPRRQRKRLLRSPSQPAHTYETTPPTQSLLRIAVKACSSWQVPLMMVFDVKSNKLERTGLQWSKNSCTLNPSTLKS